MATSDRNRFRLTGIVRWQQMDTTANGKEFARVAVETDGPEDREFSEGSGPPVFETTMVVLEMFGRAKDKAVQVGVGSEVEFVGYLHSRQYNDKWYSEFRVAGIRVLKAVAAPTPAKAAPRPVAAVAAPDPLDDIPF